MKNKKLMINLMCLYILLNPIFDLLVSNFSNGTNSISTIIRPLIPGIIFMWILIKEREYRKKAYYIIPIYILYFIGHLLIYKDSLTTLSYGSLFEEAKYIINYSYAIILLVVTQYVFKDDIQKLIKYILISASIYLSSIYIAILTNTSNSSYLEVESYKGWFNTAGLVSGIIIISLFILLVNMNKKYKIFNLIFLGLAGYYSLFLVGTRTAFIGIILLIISLIASNLWVLLFGKIKNTKHLKYIGIISIFVVIAVLIFGSNTLDRRKYLTEISDDEIHIAYDLNDIINNYELGLLNEKDIDNNRINALYKLEEYAIENNILNTDLRKQQLLYNYYLYTDNLNIKEKFLGNGYLNNFGALTLEMETFAILFNFGIIGFIIFLLPFIYIIILGVKTVITKYKKVDVNTLMYLAGVVTVIFISTFAGNVYCNTSLILFVVSLNVLLIDKIKAYKE